MKKVIIRSRLWKLNHDARKWLSRNINAANVIVSIWLIVAIGGLLWLEISAAIDSNNLRRAQERQQELLAEKATLEYQLSLCQGNIPDGPEHGSCTEFLTDKKLK